MQQPVRSIPHDRCKLSTFTTAARPLVLIILASAVAALVATLSGCADNQLPPPPPKKHDGVTLTLRCPDAAFADAIEPMVQVWATRTGATVHLKREPMSAADDSDIGVLPTSALGEWAEPGPLVPPPAQMREAGHAFQWFGVLPAYSERLVEWGGQAQAVPLAGDGVVIVYRADRLADPTARAEFQKQRGRPLAAP